MVSAIETLSAGVYRLTACLSKPDSWTSIGLMTTFAPLLPGTSALTLASKRPGVAEMPQVSGAPG